MAKIRSFRPNIQKSNLMASLQDKGAGKIQFPTTGKSLRLILLGGVGDVTKNMYVYEYGDDIVIIDCGIGFPDEGILGVDLVIPDISYLRDKKSKVRGIVISHGHDDHIAALPYLWPELDVPIYSQKLTCGLIQAKFNEHNLPKDKIKTMGIDDTVRLGVFDISFYGVAHSIPDATGIILKTPVGTLVHQSDFKMEWSPVNGQVTDVAKLARVGSSGVLFMTIDCLGVEKKGTTPSEISIQKTFEEIEEKTAGKLLITTTSSNITRIQQVVNMTAKAGRKLAVSGRSMESNFQVARDLGYLQVPGGLVIAQEEVKRFADNKLVVLIAGSQGQVGSGLSRVANHDHKFIRLNKDDAVVFSADPIPLSLVEQMALIDNLSKQGIKVYASATDANLHVSGHSSSEEKRMMLNLAKPKYILPIGGTFRHMRVFQEMVKDMGYKPEQALFAQNGEVIEIGRGTARINGHVDAFNVYVDGLGVGDVGNVVLRDRQTMAEEGIVVVMVPVNQQSGQFVGKPEIVSRGFVFEKTSEDLLEAALEIVRSCIADIKEGSHEWRYARREIEDSLEKFFYQQINRRPMIVPVVVNL